MVPLAAFVSFLAVGLIAIIIAWRGKRIDDVPHCRRCGYNLTGAVGAGCAECGSAVGPRGVRWGVRKRRPVLFCAGMVPVLLGLFGLGLVAAKVDWYEWMPFRVLMWQVPHGDVFAINELDRRVRSRLTAVQIKAYADALLGQLHAAPLKRDQVFETSLTMLMLSGNLTPSQLDRFLYRYYEAPPWDEDHPPWDKSGQWAPAEIVTPMPP